ncbi:tumor necrosis factor ligand superfamily member 18 isoform X1 [Gasterosteus aculeatus]
MPQSTQHSLIPFLLLWIALLSIVQVVVIVVFFTVGHHGPSHNGSSVTPESPMKFEANDTPLSPSEHGLLLGKGKMLTFKATEVNREMKWSAKSPDEGLVSEEEGGKVLKIRRDGYFFLNLQVTLSSCPKVGSQHTVLMKRADKVIMQGWINKETCSTGLVGKVEELYAGSSLEVTTTAGLSINESLTHLDIIYMVRP